MYHWKLCWKILEISRRRSRQPPCGQDGNGQIGACNQEADRNEEQAPDDPGNAKPISCIDTETEGPGQAECSGPSSQWH
jgi:hypothetical protein